VGTGFRKGSCASKKLKCDDDSKKSHRALAYDLLAGSGGSLAMNRFDTLRLSAERLRESHFADLVALHLDPHVMRYIGGVRSPEATRAFLVANLDHWDRHGFGLWMLRTHDAEFVGRAGIRHLIVDGAPEVEVAYAFQCTWWGKGFASEITEALVNLGFAQLKLPSMVGVVAIDHLASRRVLEKSGFVVERRLMYEGEDCVVFRRAPSDSVPT
jgi:RimJ/RimL family protein N-acetyltransferase